VFNLCKKNLMKICPQTKTDVEMWWNFPPKIVFLKTLWSYFFSFQNQHIHNILWMICIGTGPGWTCCHWTKLFNPSEPVAFLGGMGTWTCSIVHDQSKLSNTNILPTLPYMKGAFENDSLLWKMLFLLLLWHMEDLKAEMGPKVLLVFFFPCSPSAWSIFMEKRWWWLNIKFGSCDAWFGCVTDTKTHNLPPSVHYRSKMCVIKHKVYVWAGTRCILVITRHILVEQLGSQGKNTQTLLLYCLQ
jgi:hypothetical protein